MKRPFSRRALYLAGAVSLVLAVAAAGSNRAVIFDSSGQINACVTDPGKLRIISDVDACRECRVLSL